MRIFLDTNVFVYFLAISIVMRELLKNRRISGKDKIYGSFQTYRIQHKRQNLYF